MDKLFKVLCVITIMIMISGCSLDVNSDMKIKENGDFKYDVSVIFDKELINNVIQHLLWFINSKVINEFIKEITSFFIGF